METIGRFGMDVAFMRVRADVVQITSLKAKELPMQESTLTLTLRDGLVLAVGNPETLDHTEYRLQRLSP